MVRNRVVRERVVKGRIEKMMVMMDGEEKRGEKTDSEVEYGE